MSKELIDMIAVKADYEMGFSIRMLSGKYGVPKSTVADWIKRYGWEQKQKAKRQTVKQMLAESDSSDMPDGPVYDVADRRTISGSEPLAVDSDYQMMREYTQKLLRKADDVLELSEALAPRDLKSLSSMLLDVRTLLNILSPREAAEQEMRLRALQKQAEAEKQTADPVVIQFIDTEGTEI